MGEPDEVLALKRKVEKLQSKADKAEGALNALTAQLKREFGCANSDEGMKKLEKLRKREQEAKEAFDVAMAEFKETWDGVL